MAKGAKRPDCSAVSVPLALGGISHTRCDSSSKHRPLSQMQLFKSARSGFLLFLLVIVSVDGVFHPLAHLLGSLGCSFSDFLPKLSSSFSKILAPFSHFAFL